MQDLTILYVEDEDGIRENLVEFIKNFANKVFVAKNGKEGLDLYLKQDIDIVISDIKMPVMSGIEMVHQIKRLNPQQHVIFTTAHSESDYMSEAIDMQVDGYILKPIDFDKLESKLERIIEFIKLSKELSLHKVSRPEMDLEDTMFVTLGNNQNILHANEQFLSFFNIKEINDFYSKYEFFHSIFIKEDGFFYPREDENWLNDFRRVKKNSRKFMALFDETNDSLQIVVGSVYDMSDGLSVGISFKKVDSLDYFKKTNNKNHSYECMTSESKDNLKRILKKNLEENKNTTIKIINVVVHNDNITLLDELSINIARNIRHTDSLKRCEINVFGFTIIDVSNENITKIKNRLENKLFNESIKGEIIIIDINSEEDVDKCFAINEK